MFSSNGSKPNKNLAKKTRRNAGFFLKKKTCQLHHWQYSSRLPPELSQLSLFAIGLALMLQPHQVSLPHTRSRCEDQRKQRKLWGVVPLFSGGFDGKKGKKETTSGFECLFFFLFFDSDHFGAEFLSGMYSFWRKNPTQKKTFVGWSYVFTAARLPFRTNLRSQNSIFWQSRHQGRHPKLHPEVFTGSPNMGVS